MDNAAFYQKRGTLSNLKKIFANRDLFAAVFTEADRLSCSPLRFRIRLNTLNVQRPARGLAVQAGDFVQSASDLRRAELAGYAADGKSLAVQLVDLRADRFGYAAGGTSCLASIAKPVRCL